MSKDDDSVHHRFHANATDAEVAVEAYQVLSDRTLLELFGGRNSKMLPMINLI